jgi:hypothetical protein
MSEDLKIENFSVLCMAKLSGVTYKLMHKKKTSQYAVVTEGPGYIEYNYIDNFKQAETIYINKTKGL